MLQVVAYNKQSTLSFIFHGNKYCNKYWGAGYNKQSILSSIMKVLYSWQFLRLLHTNKKIKYSGACYNKQSIIFIIIPTWYTMIYHCRNGVAWCGVVFHGMV